MNEQQRRLVGVPLVRLGLGLALVVIALWAWPAAEAYADVPFVTSYGGTDIDYAIDIQQTADGGYAMVGYTYSFGAGLADVWVLKLDADGSVAWQKTYGGGDYDFASAIQQTADGGYVVVGTTYSFGAGESAVWVLKLNVDGSVAWQKTYGGAGNDSASAIQQTTDGGYVVAGSTSSFGAGERDVWVLKLDADGNVVWQKTYGGMNNEYTSDIQQTADGGYVVAGRTESFGAGDWDIWVLKVGADGSVAWQKTYGGMDWDFTSAVQQTVDGGYVLAAMTNWADVWVLKLDSDGSIIWQRTYGGAGEDHAAAIQQTADGGYVVAGDTESFGAGSEDAWVLKLDANGGFCEECPLGEDTNMLSEDSTATVADSIVTSVDSTATVADSSATVDNTNVVPNPICVCIQPDLSVTKIVTPTDEVPYHGAVTYTVVLGNAGTLSDTSVLLTDTLPVEVDFARWVGQPAEAEVIDDELTWQGTVTAGQAITFTFVVSHVGVYGDTVTNTAEFSGTLQAGEDSATFTVAWPALALFIAKDAKPAFDVPYHSAVTYTVVLANAGPVSDTTVLLTDTLPVEVDFGRWVEQPAGAEVVADELTWQGTVTTGESITLTFVVSHVGEYGDTATNTVRFSGTLQAGEDSATFTVAAYTVHLPLVLKNHSDLPRFAITYGGADADEAHTIQQTADGGYVVAGYTESFGAGGYDAWVFKLNADGSIAWQKTYGGADWDEANAIQQTADGGYVVAGYTESFGAGGYGPWVFKLDGGGNVAWQKTYGGAGYNSAYAIRQTTDGGYIVTALTFFGGGETNAGMLKLDAGGNVTWQKAYGGADSDYAPAIQQTADGGYVVAGYTESFGAGGYDAWVLKLNANGSVAWQKTYGGVDYDFAGAIQQTSDDGYIVTGETESFGAGGYDAWVLKLNAGGSVVWQKTYGGMNGDYAYTIQQTTDGGYVVAGGTESFGTGDLDFWVLKLNADGSVAWQKTYGGMDDEYVYAIQQTIDGGYVVVGYTYSFGAGGSDPYVLKLSAAGDLCAGCLLGEDTSVLPADSAATMVDSTAIPADSDATVTDSYATVMDTNVIPEPICVCASSIGNRAE